MPRQQRTEDRRREVAALAARHLAEGAADSFEDAGERALHELQAGRGDRPDGRQMQAALAEYLALFDRERHAQRCRTLRSAALEAMRELAAFDPRLVGPVWYGTACEFTPVCLHVFSDETEALSRFLIARRIPFELGESPQRFARHERPVAQPMFVIERKQATFELIVFPPSGAFHRPLSGLDRRPVKRANVQRLEAILEAGTVFTDELSQYW